MSGPESKEDRTLDRLVELMLTQSGKGCDCSNLDIELREINAKPGVVSDTLVETVKQVNEAGEDAAEALRAEIIDTEAIEKPALMTSAAVPPGEVKFDNVTFDLEAELGPELEQMAAEYSEDPAKLRSEDTIAANAKAAAYFSLRAALIAYGRFNRLSAVAFATLHNGIEQEADPRLVRDVVVGVMVGLITAAIIGAVS